MVSVNAHSRITYGTYWGCLLPPNLLVFRIHNNLDFSAIYCSQRFVRRGHKLKDKRKIWHPPNGLLEKTFQKWVSFDDVHGKSILLSALQTREPGKASML